jgi:hypothetical protein
MGTAAAISVMRRGLDIVLGDAVLADASGAGVYRRSFLTGLLPFPGDTIVRMTASRLVEFPPVPPGDDLVISATTFSTYERCPEQAAGRLRGIYGPESRSSFVGGLAHRLFARHLTTGPIDAQSVADACREEIGAGMNPKLTSLGLKPSQLGKVIEEVGGLYERFKKMPTEGFAGAEVQLESEPADGVVLRGSIDAVFEDDGGTRLIDWKTAGLGDPGPQLAFYALLWALERGEVPGHVEAVSVGTGERTDEVPTSAGIQETAMRVAEIATELRRVWASGGDLERTAGPWCRWCPLLDDCAEGMAAHALLEA